jgi:hypothetical protein
VQRIHSSSTFSKPLLHQRRAHLVVAEELPSSRSAVRPARWVVLDGRGLELLGDALLHVARGLAHLEQARVRLVGNGVGVDARPGFRLGREDFVDGFTQ